MLRLLLVYTFGRVYYNASNSRIYIEVEAKNTKVKADASITVKKVYGHGRMRFKP
jgi:hypothetical protein